MALTTVAESLEMELSLLVFTTYVCSGRDSTLRMRGEILNRLHHRGSKNPFKYLVHFLVFLSFYVFSKHTHQQQLQESLPKYPI